MPKRTDIKKVLVIGSGPIVIGQAAEFDYAGTQACLALKEEGYEVILCNSNPATIMTDTSVADKVYMEPLTLEYVAKIIRYERPDAILPGIGGQTGLNLAMQLEKKGVLAECRTELLGTKSSSIERAEDREQFKELCESLGEPVEAFRGQREELKRAINAQWDARKLAWPDSIHADGTVSEEASMHTSMLALLYDAANPEHVAAARANTVTPRAELIRVASPFAALYLYEAFEKIGMADEILKTIYRDYLPMLRLGSTTVWETFPAALNTGEFPTRSHCHGWSAAPLYFLPRLVLGILPAAPGAMKFRISPRITGLEFAYGIPGTVGGAVYMNAGAYGGEMKDVLVSVRYLTTEGEIVEIPAEQLDLRYRHSIFEENGGCILSAKFHLARGNAADIRARMDDLMARRKDKQPLDKPSTFKRPVGAFAAALIDQCGLRGYRHGGAAVSDKHCGFVVNLGGATCADVLALCDEVRAIVKEKTGYDLEKEIRVVEA